jgi:phosphatidylglycerophosphate synthase
MIKTMGPSPTYAPTSRRPIAGAFRKTAGAAVRLCVARNVHPDVISYLSIVAAGAAAACYLFAGRWPILLLIAPLLCFLRLWFNMLDGMVALAAGKASRRGEIVNELPDRISDILIFAGVAHSGLANPFLAYWAAILAVMTAYVGTLGQALTGKRRFGGLMSKQYRMLVLAIGTWALFGARDGRFAVMDWTLWAIVAGCVQTIVVRLVHIIRDLDRGESTP